MTNGATFCCRSRSLKPNLKPHAGVRYSQLNLARALHAFSSSHTYCSRSCILLGGTQRRDLAS